jgi:hypothetical protein
MENELVSQSKLADILGCTRKALRAAVKKHDIPHQVLEHAVRKDQMFDLQTVRAFLRDHPHIWKDDLDPKRSRPRTKLHYDSPTRAMMTWVTEESKWGRRKVTRTAIFRFLRFAGEDPSNWTLKKLLEWETILFASNIKHTSACDYVANVQRILEDVQKSPFWAELTQKAATPSPAPAPAPQPAPRPAAPQPSVPVRIRKPGKPSRPVVEALAQAEADKIAEDLLDELFIYFGEGRPFCWTDVHRAVVGGDVGLSAALEDAGLPKDLIDWGARFNNYLKLLQSKRFDSGLGLEADLQQGLYRAHRPMAWKIVREGTLHHRQDPREADIFDVISKTHTTIAVEGCDLSTQQLNMVRSHLASMSMTVDRLYETARTREGR